MARRLSGRTSRPFTHLLALKAIAVEGARTQAELAERLTMDAPAVSRLVDRLEEDGLVKRCAGENRRCVRLQATEASQADLAVLEEVARSVDAEAARYLTDAEMCELKRLLEKLHLGLTHNQVAAEDEPRPEGTPGRANPA